MNERTIKITRCTAQKKFVRAKSAFFVCDRNRQENEHGDGRRTQKLKEDKKRHLNIHTNLFTVLNQYCVCVIP